MSSDISLLVVVFSQEFFCYSTLTYCSQFKDTIPKIDLFKEEQDAGAFFEGDFPIGLSKSVLPCLHHTTGSKMELQQEVMPSWNLEKDSK
jgi:hypothetical protein